VEANVNSLGVFEVGTFTKLALFARRRAVEVDVPPMAVLFLPDARFFKGLRRGRPVGVRALREADIGHEGDVAHDSNVRRDHRGEPPAPEPAQIEVELVKRQPGDQLSPRFGLKSRHRVVAQLLIGGPIARRNGVEEFLGQSDELGFHASNLVPRGERGTSAAAK